LLTAAEWNHEKPSILEAIRKKLYEEKPPPKNFIEWFKSKREEPPPID